MRALQLTIERRDVSVVVRVNFHLQDIPEVRAFIACLAEELRDPNRIRMSFARIASPLSVRCESGGNAPDLEGAAAAASMLALAELHGFEVLPASLAAGSCTAQSAMSLVVDQDLQVFKCPLQMPDNACAEIALDGSIRALDQEWFTLPTEIPECALGCLYGPICGGGCALTDFESRGNEDCEYKRLTAQSIMSFLLSRLGLRKPIVV